MNRLTIATMTIEYGTIRIDKKVGTFVVKHKQFFKIKKVGWLSQMIVKILVIRLRCHKLSFKLLQTEARILL